MILRGLLPALLAAAQPEAPAVVEALRMGDEHYSQRAHGARGGVAEPGPIEDAMAQYRRALNLDPNSYAARLRLLRAMYFRGGYCGITLKDEIKLFEEAKRLADETVRRLEIDLKQSRLAAHREALRREPLAAEIYLWAAVSWGQWAVSHKVNAAWQGAPGRIRDLAQAVVDIEPTTMFGGGYVILGRLHAEAPRIPMLTPWISRQKATDYLRQAHAIAPTNSANVFFLAQALVQLEPARREEAKLLLERCAVAPPRPEFAVEDSHYAAEARDLLKEAFGVTASADQRSSVRSPSLMDPRDLSASSTRAWRFFGAALASGR